MSDSNRCGQVRKNINDDLREAVSNFDELRSHYVGTPYEQMFDEVLVSVQSYRQHGTNIPHNPRLIIKSASMVPLLSESTQKRTNSI